jgi:hypothetical protein
MADHRHETIKDKKGNTTGYRSKEGRPHTHEKRNGWFGPSPGKRTNTPKKKSSW